MHNSLKQTLCMNVPLYHEAPLALVCNVYKYTMSLFHTVTYWALLARSLPCVFRKTYQDKYTSIKSYISTNGVYIRPLAYVGG